MIDASVLARRLEAKCTPEPNSGCWLWFGSSLPTGYGNFWNGKYKEGAHRVAWRLFRGDIPDGMFVCHRCDNPSCVNPGHLFLGTPKQNSADRDRKGRCKVLPVFVGSLHPRAKLNEDKVKEIFRLRGGGMSYAQIAKRFQVGNSVIAKVLSRETWSHVDANGAEVTS
jgi:hypothetical protein